MNNTRYTKILFWNIRGINSQEKWDAIKDKVSKSACQVICLQETKRENFDIFYIKKFCPRNIDHFAFSPSIGASGGFLTAWNSSIFYGIVIQSNSYAIIVKLSYWLDNKSFHVTNIFGPSHLTQKQGFITWLINFDTSGFDDWILGGDFNLIRQNLKIEKNQVVTYQRWTCLMKLF